MWRSSWRRCSRPATSWCSTTNDHDAADFDSLALLGLAYGGAFSDAGATEDPAALRTRMRAAAVAQEVFRREPKQRSPGAGPGWDGRTGPAHGGTIHTERVGPIWGIDLTSTLIGEGQASVFVTVDHASTECLGSDAARRATRVEALEPLRQGVRACFGAFAEGIAGDLKLRHEHGSQFVADDDQRELALLGIASSPAFVHKPEGNGCVERFIRTLKEDLLWVQRFATIEELRLALHAFKDSHNQSWIVERHGYQTPAAVRAAQLAPLPAAA